MPYEDIEKGFERIMREDLKFRGDKTDHIEVIIDDSIDGNFFWGVAKRLRQRALNPLSKVRFLPPQLPAQRQFKSGATRKVML